MNVLLARVLGLFALVLGFLAVIADPDPAWSPAGLQTAGLALAGALFWSLSALGIGGGLLKEARGTDAFALGLGLLGLAQFVGMVIFGVQPLVLGLVGLVGCLGWITRPRLRWPSLPTAVCVLGIVWLAVGMLDALAPPVDTDEIYYHLAVPKHLLLRGELFGGLLHPDASRPLPVHALWVGALAWGGEATPGLLHVVICGMLLIQVWDMGVLRYGQRAAVFAGLLLLGSYTVVRELGLAYNNLPAALWALCALRVALEGKGRTMAVFAGMALAAKYTSAPLVFGIFLAWWWGRGLLALPRLVALGALSLLFVAPWWIRNLAEGLHPLFPYLGWPQEQGLSFMMSQKYGMGRGAVDMLLLPWHLVAHAEIDSFRFLGRLSPLWLAGLPVALVWGVGKRDRVLGVGLVAFVGWAIGPHWLRYLLPALPVLALGVGAALAVLPRWACLGAFLVWVAGLPRNLGPWLEAVADRSAVALGHEERQDYLERSLDGWGAVSWVNEASPADSQVALLFAWPGYYLERPYVLGSVEDHIPTRHFLTLHGENSLQALSEMGVSHVLASHVHFTHKSYAFLSEEEYEAGFSVPESLLEDRLLADTEQVFAEGRFGVWRLVKP